jgi:predicted nucleic acid-binding protein
MAIAWDTTAVGRLARPGPARDLALERMAEADPIGIPSPCLLELAFGYRRALERGNRRFEPALRWIGVSLRSDPVGEILPLDDVAAVVAGEIRALCPFPPGRRSRHRSTAEARASWLLDIEIAAAAWVAGFDLATDNRRDFEAIAEAIGTLAPGAPRFAVVSAET